jgi:uncharacterized protein (DUF342 family)
MANALLADTAECNCSDAATTLPTHALQSHASQEDNTGALHQQQLQQQQQLSDEQQQQQLNGQQQPLDSDVEMGEAQGEVAKEPVLEGGIEGEVEVDPDATMDIDEQVCVHAADAYKCIHEGCTYIYHIYHDVYITIHSYALLIG